LIEAAATYPGNSMAEIFIQRIIARAATYGLAKEEIGDVCPWGHEINQMFPGMLKHMRPDKKGEARGPIAQFRGKAFDRIEAITFEEWRKKKRGEELDEIESWVDSFFAKPKRIERMLVDEAGPYFEGYFAGWNHESFEQEKIAHLMMGMDDPRLSGMSREIWLVVRRGDKLEVHPGVWNDRAFTFNECNVNLENASVVGWIEKKLYRKPDVPKRGIDFGVEQVENPHSIRWINFDVGRYEGITKNDKVAKLMHSMRDPRLSGEERDIWIVREGRKKGEPVGGGYKLEVWSGRYSECYGPHYTEGPHRNGDWIGWMEKEDYERPKGEGDGR